MSDFGKKKSLNSKAKSSDDKQQDTTMNRPKGEKTDKNRSPHGKGGWKMIYEMCVNRLQFADDAHTSHTISRFTET